MNIEHFDHWLAGLLDGEGCFFAKVYPQPDGRLPVTVRCEIGLRADDRPLLEEIQRVTGLGKIYSRSSRAENWAPVCTWRVSGRECSKMLDRLDAAPLRSKKQRDYALWRQIVVLYAQTKQGGPAAKAHNRETINQIEQLAVQLKEVRKYAPHR